MAGFGRINQSYTPGGINLTTSGGFGGGVRGIAPPSSSGGDPFFDEMARLREKAERRGDERFGWEKEDRATARSFIPGRAERMNRQLQAGPGPRLGQYQGPSKTLLKGAQDEGLRAQIAQATAISGKSPMELKQMWGMGGFMGADTRAMTGAEWGVFLPGSSSQQAGPGEVAAANVQQDWDMGMNRLRRQQHEEQFGGGGEEGQQQQFSPEQMQALLRLLQQGG